MSERRVRDVCESLVATLCCVIDGNIDEWLQQRSRACGAAATEFSMKNPPPLTLGSDVRWRLRGQTHPASIGWGGSFIPVKVCFSYISHKGLLGTAGDRWGRLGTAGDGWGRLEMLGTAGDRHL